MLVSTRKNPTIETQIQVERFDRSILLLFARILSFYRYVDRCFVSYSNVSTTVNTLDAGDGCLPLFYLRNLWYRNGKSSGEAKRSDPVRSFRCTVKYFEKALTIYRLISFPQGGSSDVSAHGSLQENEAPQGLDILSRVDTRRTADGHRKQRQDCQTDALQRRHVQPRR